MPGFWTVLKWAVAITLAPILVWITVVGIGAVIIVGNAMCAPAPVKPPVVKKYTPR